MSSKIKNIIMFVVIGVAFALIYIFLFKKGPPVPNTVTVPAAAPFPGGTAPIPPTGALTSDQKSAITQEFLTLLLNIRSIKLEDSIFSDKSFNTLKDSTIELTPDGSEGRPNPFAPIGTDSIEAAAVGASTTNAQ